MRASFVRRSDDPSIAALWTWPPNDRITRAPPGRNARSLPFGGIHPYRNQGSMAEVALGCHDIASRPKTWPSPCLGMNRIGGGQLGGGGTNPLPSATSVSPASLPASSASTVPSPSLASMGPPPSMATGGPLSVAAGPPPFGGVAGHRLHPPLQQKRPISIQSALTVQLPFGNFSR
jgi:hypothetical protein